MERAWLCMHVCVCVCVCVFVLPLRTIAADGYYMQSHTNSSGSRCGTFIQYSDTARSETSLQLVLVAAGAAATAAATAAE